MTAETAELLVTATWNLEVAITKLKALVLSPEGTRPLSVALTHAETAALWLAHDVELRPDAK